MPIIVITMATIVSPPGPMIIAIMPVITMATIISPPGPVIIATMPVITMAVTMPMAVVTVR